jgi:sugar fermentation stimulation protein A
MTFDRPLIRGILLRRYKRFLADVMLDDGEPVTAHCANPGAMLGLNQPGTTVWLEPSANPRRKLAYTWRLVGLEGGGLAGVDTGVPNRIVGEALRARGIPTLAEYAEVRAEVRYGTGSRIDFLLSAEGEPDAYVEVKNVHLRRDGELAEFPDCVTARGTKHLRELARIAAKGCRAVTLYVIQRTDCRTAGIAADIDPTYADAFVEARLAGMDVCAHATRITAKGIWLDRELAFVDP